MNERHKDFLLVASLFAIGLNFGLFFVHLFRENYLYVFYSLVAYTIWLLVLRHLVAKNNKNEWDALKVAEQIIENNK